MVNGSRSHVDSITSQEAFMFRKPTETNSMLRSPNTCIKTRIDKELKTCKWYNLIIKLNKFPGNVKQYKSLKSLLLTKPCIFRGIKSIKIKSNDRIFLSEVRQINQHAQLSHARWVLKTREIIFVPRFLFCALRGMEKNSQVRRSFLLELPK